MKKLMGAYCDRQGVNLESIRFLFNGQRIQPEQDPSMVCFTLGFLYFVFIFLFFFSLTWKITMLLMLF